jgi:hypothetical protein
MNHKGQLLEIFSNLKTDMSVTDKTITLKTSDNGDSTTFTFGVDNQLLSVKCAM